jgi:hypothetical protein
MTDTFNLSCPECGLSRPAKSEFIGRRVKCSCGNVFAVEDPGAVEFEQFAHMRDGLAPAIESLQPTVAMAQRKRVQSDRLRAIGMALFLGTGLLVAWWAIVRDKLSAQPVLAMFATDEAHDFVERWLRDSTHSGEWEEVKWMPPRPVKGYPAEVCQIRYRTANAFGAKMLTSVIFLRIKDGEWIATEMPRSMTAEHQNYESLKKLYAIAMALDPDLVDEIDRYGSDRAFTAHILRNVAKDYAEASE